MVARLRDAIQRGTNAARPAATAVDVGTLYYDTTNSLLSRSDGTSWETVGETAGLGAWTTFTPTLTASVTNPTIGNGTLSGRYKALDSKTYCIVISWTFGSTSAAGSGVYSFALPSGLTSGALRQHLAGNLLDSGTDNKLAIGDVGPSATTVGQVIVEGVNSLSDTSPIVWATGDSLTMSGIIEVA